MARHERPHSGAQATPEEAYRRQRAQAIRRAVAVAAAAVIAVAAIVVAAVVIGAHH